MAPIRVICMYRFFIFPIETGYRYLYQALHAVTGSYGVSLVLMSLLTTVLITPLMKYANRVQMKEREIQDVLYPQMEKIKAESVGGERHERISRLYRRYAYHPIYSIRSALGVFLQVPFLMGAYYMVRHFSGITGESFGAIADLSRPDGLLGGIHLLPLLMTVINMFSACITPGFGKKEIRQAWVIALLFLVLLYNAPSALLVFWTCNNLWGVFANLRDIVSAHGSAAFSVVVENVKSCVPSFSSPAMKSRAVALFHLSFFLICFQASLSFFFNDTDVKQSLIVYLLTLLLMIFSTYLFVRESRKKAKGIAPILFLSWGSVLFLWLRWGSFFYESHGLSFSYLQDVRAALIYVAQSLVRTGEKQRFMLYAVQLAASALLIFFSHYSVKNRNEIGDRLVCCMKNCPVIVLAIVASITFQAANNVDYLTIRTLPILYLLLTLLSMGFYLLVLLLWGTSISCRDVSMMVALFVAILVINPTLQAYVKWFSATTRIFSLVFLPLAVFLSFKQITRKSVLVFMTILVFASLCNGIVSWLSLNAGYVDTSSTRQEAEIIDGVKIQESEKKNVFFLVYDSIPDIKTLEKLQIDASALTELLGSKGFKVYDDTYSIRNSSHESMSRTFDISDRAHISQVERSEICAGEGKAFQIFKGNNYSTCSIQDSYMTGGKMFVDDYWPPMEKRSSHEMNNLFILLQGIFMGEFKFDIEGLKRYDESTYHFYLRDDAAKRKGPWFTAMHIGKPGHSQNSGKLLPNETELFQERLDAAIPFLKDDIDAILSNDPSAIIIILGDHGPYLTGDGFLLANYAGKDVTELMIRDRFGTLIAIRWPDPGRAQKYDADLLVNQDIFPVVFAYLADSLKPLDLMIKDKRAVMKGHAYLDNGNFIPYSPASQ